jgi:uncharacterized C2H2 Zn-finger protein
MSDVTRAVDKEKIRRLLLNGELQKIIPEDDSVTVVRQSFEKIVHSNDGAYSNYLSCRRCGKFFKYSGTRLSGTSTLTEHLSKRCVKKGKSKQKETKNKAIENIMNLVNSIKLSIQV